jgi:hypothetical protein
MTQSSEQNVCKFNFSDGHGVFGNLTVSSSGVTKEGITDGMGKGWRGNENGGIKG